MATVEKRGPYQYRAKVRKKGFQSVTKTFEYKKDAETWARQQESEMERGAFICAKEAENTILAEALDRYSREITVEKKGKDMELYRIKTWKKHPLAERSLSSLRGSDFASYRDERLKAGRAGNTIRLELAIISHLFTIARKEWGMESLANPIQAIRLPKVSKARDRRLVGDEEERLFKACEQSRSKGLKDAVLLAIETAMRQAELLGIEWQHVNLQRRFIHLPETKNGTSRDVPLSPKAIEILERRGKVRKIDDDRVFSEWKSPNNFKHTWSRAVKRAELEDFRFHDLRHEATSRFFEKGLRIEMVRAITGHKTLQMLMRYTHLRAEDIAEMLK
ncbi:MAG: site-specific integrase [Desulfobulbaceae bacterium]|nr:site-specific integrase [Desulfobulbaceae bacterium]